MNDLGLRLKKLRKAKGLNQEELAQILGVGKTTISNYETGYTTPTSVNLRQLASFYGVSLDALVDGPLPIDLFPDSAPSPKADHLNEDPTQLSGMKNISVYLSLSGPLSDAVPAYQLSLPTSFVGEGSFFGLKVSGDKMDRCALPDGSVAIVRRQELADDGDIVAVSLGANLVFISRYYRVGENIVLLSESNNPVYRPVVISQRDQAVKIYGKVIKSIQSVF